ncbi:MAG: MarR family winged helix-turn-helix transcriptional regulator [Ostreibacterium sp.]
MKKNKTADNLQLDKFLPYRLNILAKRISNSLSSIYADEFNITIAEWRILAWIKSRPNLYASDICTFTQMEKTQVSRVIATLEKRGLVGRKTNSNDLRRHQLHLTSEGITLINNIIPKVLDWETQLLEALSPTQYHDFLLAIEKLEKQALLK